MEKSKELTFSVAQLTKIGSTSAQLVSISTVSFDVGRL